MLALLLQLALTSSPLDARFEVQLMPLVAQANVLESEHLGSRWSPGLSDACEGIPNPNDIGLALIEIRSPRDGLAINVAAELGLSWSF